MLFSCAIFMLLSCAITSAGRTPPARERVERAPTRRHAQRWTAEDMEVHPNRRPTRKEAADSGARFEQAAHMPWFPRHDLVCGDHDCRPGEGNTKGYVHWGQPYIHREGYVQSRSRVAPHSADPLTYYADLVRVASRIADDRLVIMAAADWDYREVALNVSRASQSSA